MRNKLEFDALRYDILSTKQDVLNRIEDFINTSSSEETKNKLKSLKCLVCKGDIEEIESNLDLEEIPTYFVDEEEFSVYKAVAKEFFFEYDNDLHELFVASSTIDTEDNPIYKV